VNRTFRKCSASLLVANPRSNANCFLQVDMNIPCSKIFSCTIVIHLDRDRRRNCGEEKRHIIHIITPRPFFLFFVISIFAIVFHANNHIYSCGLVSLVLVLRIGEKKTIMLLNISWIITRNIRRGCVFFPSHSGFHFYCYYCCLGFSLRRSEETSVEI